MPGSRHPAVVPALLIVYADAAGLGFVIPVLPSLIQGVAGVDLAQAARIGGLLLFAYALMQFCFAAFIAGLSDHFGRRPVLISTLVLLGVDYLVMAIAPGIVWLVLTRCLSGVLGATYAAANSVLADISDETDRARNFGLVGAAAGLGLISGPAIGGLAGTIDYHLPFMLAAAFVLLVACMAYFRLPETLAAADRRSLRSRTLNPIGSMLELGSDRNSGLLLCTNFLAALASQAQLAVWSFYTVLQLRWRPSEIGASIAVYGVLIAVAQGVLPVPAARRLGERRAIVGALCAAPPAYLLFAFARSDWQAYAGILMGSLSALAFPMLKAHLSARTDATRQGQLQGALASSEGLAAVLGPLTMTSLFAAFADSKGPFVPGAPFLLSAILYSAAILLAAVALGKAGGGPGCVRTRA